jgi:hypothetical protein
MSEQSQYFFWHSLDESHDESAFEEEAVETTQLDGVAGNGLMPSRDEGDSGGGAPQTPY